MLQMSYWERVRASLRLFHFFFERLRNRRHRADLGNRLAKLEKKDSIPTNFAGRRFLKPLAFVFMAWSPSEMTLTHWNTLMEGLWAQVRRAQVLCQH